MRRHSTRAATLIELITVIAILSVLAAILTPVFARAKRSAKIARSKSNMRQIALAIRLYDETPDWSSLPDFTVLVPYEMLYTGGEALPSKYDVYTQFYMTYSADQQAEWLEFVNISNQNPALIVDETWAESADHRAVTTKYGVFFDGHLETRRYSGTTALKHWEPR